jgi:hypothetical protein
MCDHKHTARKGYVMHTWDEKLGGGATHMITENEMGGWTCIWHFCLSHLPLPSLPNNVSYKIIIKVLYAIQAL